MKKRIKLIKGDYPNFVNMGNCALRWIGNNKYYRDAGMWEVTAEWINEELFSAADINHPQLGGHMLVPISRGEWADNNTGYVPSTEEMNEDIRNGMPF